MTAKQQPMAGQSDAADDLIAELAKLMAQDAKVERPAEKPFPAFSVRIPGGDSAPPPASASGFNFDYTTPVAADKPAPSQAAPTPASAPAAEPVVTPAPAAAVPPPTERAPAPVATAPTPDPELPEPFRFDFDLGAPRSAATPAAPPASTPAAPIPAASTQPTPAPAPASAAPASQAAPAADHDSIADLIAAEFLDPPPAPEPAPPAAAAVPPRAAPQPGAGWSPTAVTANLDGDDKPAHSPLRALNLQPTVKPEQDRFKVPPVFGLASKPADPVEPSVSPVVAPPAAPPVVETSPVLRQPSPTVAFTPSATEPQDDDLGRDPIDEIEHLIGRAMRVEFEKPAEQTGASEERPAPSPALRSLATPTVAAPTFGQVPAPGPLSGADEAILAAAQATGAQIGWVEAPEVDQAAIAEPAPRAPRLRRPLGFTRAVAGPLVAVTLLLAAGFGLYWVLGLGRDSGPAPLLTADTSPVKETPAAQPESASAQQSVVFNEINGVVPGAEEQLVSRDQSDVNEVTQVPPTADLSEEGLANRKVRTVTVRPDGTIVSGEESVAGSAILPVDRPNVPTVPGAETASPELLASAEPIAATPAAAPTAEVAATPAVTPVTPGSTVQAVDVAGIPLAGKTAPVPMLRPAGLVQSTAPTPVTAVVDTPTAGGNLLPPPPANSTLGAAPVAQPAATQPVAAAQPSTTIPGAVEVDALPNSAPAYAQLASLRSEEEARQAAQRLVTRFGPLFGGANMEVQRVDLGARGIYYRVRVPAQSVQAAGNICTNVVAAGGDCVPM